MNIKLHAEIKGTEREEKWEYPIEAIREAITNAICHRNYETASNVQIRIFDDRIEIWGCVLLPEPLTPEDLKREHKSILTNKEYRELNSNISDRTALNDLNELVDKGIIVAKGEKRYRYYILR